MEATDSDRKSVSRLSRIDAVVNKIVRYISYVSAFCLVGIMLVAFINVILEKTLRIGIPQSTEIIQYLHVPVVFLAVAWVTFDRGHVSIDLISAHFPAKMQYVVSYISNTISMLICGFVAYRGLIMTLKFIENHKKSTTGLVSFDLWPFGLLLSIGGFMLAFSFLWVMIRRSAKLPPIQFEGFGNNAEFEETEVSENGI